MGAAVGFEHPDVGPLANDEFSGGEHGAKGKLEELGFDVVPRPALAAADTLPLRDAMAAALSAQQTRVPGEWSDDLQKAVAVTLPNAIRLIVGESFRVRGSAGAGNQAEIPWVFVLPPGLKGASEGRYAVYLFSASGDAVFLSLSQAVTGHAKSDLEGLAAELREDAGSHPDLVEQIDLGAKGELGLRYELATAYAIKSNNTNDVPSLFDGFENPRPSRRSKGDLRGKGDPTHRRPRRGAGSRVVPARARCRDRLPHPGPGRTFHADRASLRRLAGDDC